MAELKDILASGSIPLIDSTLIKEAGSEVISKSNLEVNLSEVNSDGIRIPEVLSADAENGTIFFDPSEGQIRYKSPAGILLRFRMRLV